MKMLDSVEFAWHAIISRKKRSFLTILGISVGISAIISLLSLGGGFEMSVGLYFEESFKSNMITLTKQESIHSRTDFETILYASDGELLETIEHVEIAVPILQKQIEIPQGNGSFSSTVYGIPFQEYSHVFERFLLVNGTFPGSDNTSLNSIIVGNGLFSLSNPDDLSALIGQNLSFYWSSRVNKTFQTLEFEHEISGVLKPVNGYTYFGAPSDTSIYMDLALAQTLFQTEECSMILLLLADDSPETIHTVSQRVQEVYGEDIGILTLKDMIESVSSVMTIVTAFLAAIAAISLLVAGIGIMNIMTISLMERTKEIGILKALGLSDRKLFFIFLLESFIVAILGVIIGIIVGVIFSLGAVSFINNRIDAGTSLLSEFSTSSPINIKFRPVFTVGLISFTSLFGIGVALFFGFLPAKKAAHLPPVSAIHHF